MVTVIGKDDAPIGTEPKAWELGLKLRILPVVAGGTAARAISYIEKTNRKVAIMFLIRNFNWTSMTLITRTPSFS
jgi:hypothetical protein